MTNLAYGLEKCWKESRLLAWSLVISGALSVFWAIHFPQSPGVSIGLLALAAGIMSLRPEMRIGEKFAWILILVVLAVLEVRSIKKSDEENKRIREAQNETFEHIAEDLKESDRRSKEQFKTTVDHVDNVLGTAHDLAALAKDNLENVTGGDSFAFVYPEVIGGSGGNTWLKVHNNGDQILTGVTVTIQRVISADPLDCNPMVEPRRPFTAGVFAPHDGRTIPLPEGLLQPKLRPDGTDYYRIYINAQNPGANEFLQFRRSKDGRSLAYKFEVSKNPIGKRKPTDTYICNTWMRPVKQSDWIEPN